MNTTHTPRLNADGFIITTTKDPESEYGDLDREIKAMERRRRIVYDLADKAEEAGRQALFDRLNARLDDIDLDISDLRDLRADAAQRMWASEDRLIAASWRW